MEVEPPCIDEPPTNALRVSQRSRLFKPTINRVIFAQVFDAAASAFRIYRSDDKSLIIVSPLAGSQHVNLRRSIRMDAGFLHNICFQLPGQPTAGG